MPNFDGTGPMGRGPMTGRCRGFCVIPIRKAEPVFGVGRGGIPWGCGRGRTFGRGRGICRWMQDQNK